MAYEYDEELTPEENIAHGLFAIANAIVFAAKHLGHGDASTPMGTLEAMTVQMDKHADQIAGSLSEMAEAIQDIRFELQEHRPVKLT